MKLKKLYVAFFLCVCMSACSEEYKSVSANLSAFYKYYIIEEFENDRAISVDTMGKYFTQRFLALKTINAHNHEWDPVTHTQDYSDKMLATLHVKFIGQQNGMRYFNLTFREEYKNRKYSRILVLKLENELWKIDTIINNDGEQFHMWH